MDTCETTRDSLWGGRGRFKSSYSEDNNLKYERYFFGDYEKEVFAGGSQRHLNYVYAGGSLVGIFEQTGTVQVMHYVYQDYLGSIRCITDENGNIEQALSYDAWGNRRDPATGDTIGAQNNLMLARGFTGHEHLDEFGLINMNGRVYDPAIALFLSPDNFVQDPGNSQNFNRYTYALNNPLMYTDPDGESFLAFAIGFVVMSYLSGVADNSGELNPFQWDPKQTDFVKMGFMGLLGGFGGCWIEGLSLGTSSITVGTQLLAGVGAPSAYVGINYSMNDNFSFQWTNNFGQSGSVPISNALGGNFQNTNNANQSLSKLHENISRVSQNYTQPEIYNLGKKSYTAYAYPGYLHYMGVVDEEGPERIINSFWNNVNFDFTGNVKISLGVQAGSTVGTLGGKFGLHANLFSVSLLGYENGQGIYPGSRKNGLTQFNQSVSGGYFAYFGVNHTWNSTVLQERNWSNNSQVSYDVSSKQGFGINSTRNSLTIGLSAKAALILGIEGSFGLTIAW